MASLSEQIKNHFQRSRELGHKELKFGAGPVQLTYFTDEGRGVIDVVADVEKNPYKLKEHFEKVREALPEGEWELNPDTPQKQRIYQRWFRNDPNIRPSGDLKMKGIGREGFIMTKNNVPWIVQNDIYKLVDDSPKNRRLLETHLTDRIKKGYKPRGILYGKNKVPHRISTKSISRVLDPNDKLNKINLKRSNPESKRPGDIKAQTDFQRVEPYSNRVRQGMVANFIDNQRITPGKLHGHHVRMLQMYRPFFEGLSDHDQKRLAQFAVDEKFPLGDAKANIAILDEQFHDEIHKYMIDEGFQVSSKKGLTDKHGIPDLGDTFESRKAALGVFFTNVQEPIERKLNKLSWDQHAKHNPPTQVEVDEALAWLNDNERIADERSLLSGLTDDDITKVPYGSKPKPAIFARMAKASKLATNLGRGESALRIASGDVVGGGIGMALSTPMVQKQIGKQIVKAGLRSIPGVSIGSGVLQGAGYAASGQYGKAALSIAGGVIGEFGPVGDAVQAGIDLGLTGSDIKGMKSGQWDSLPNRKKLLYSAGALQ